MEEKNRSMTDEALSQQLRRHRSGKLAGRLLSLVGVVIAVAGMVLSGNIVPIILAAFSLSSVFAAAHGVCASVIT